MSDFLIVLLLAAFVGMAAATMLAALVGTLGFPSPSVQQRIGCIDGLRGYLALSVMVHHFFIWTQIIRFDGVWGPPTIHIMNQLGSGSVALFFMTTGIVFYPRILNGLRKNDWIIVYVSRVFRILPLVAISLAIVTVIVVLRTGAALDLFYVKAAARWISAWSEPDLLGYADSGRINAYVLWSLRYEWIFYVLLLPICAALADMIRLLNYRSWILPVFLIISSIFARILLFLLHLHLEILKYIPLFAIGMLAFECQSRRIFVENLKGPAVAVVAGVALLLGMSIAQFPYTFALPLFGFFFITVACGNPLGGILTIRGARILGECSFGLYLLHGIVLDVLFTDGRALVNSVSTSMMPALLPLVMIAAFLISAIAYLAVERPAIRLGRWLARQISGRRIRTTNAETEVAP